MMVEPYRTHLEVADVFASARPVRGRVAAVLQLAMENRFLRLIVPRSRVVRRGDIVELVSTAEAEAGPGSEVSSVGYLAFVEIEQGGVVLVGDRVTIKGAEGPREAGVVVGFDETHAPNHINVVLRVPKRVTGAEAGWQLDHEVTFVFEEGSSA